MKVCNDIIINTLAGMTIVRKGDLAGEKKTRIISLNSSSEWLLRAMTGRDFNEEEAVSALMSHYEVDEATARRDVSAWIESLKGGGIIE